MTVFTVSSSLHLRRHRKQGHLSSCRQHQLFVQQRVRGRNINTQNDDFKVHHYRSRHDLMVITRGRLGSEAPREEIMRRTKVSVLQLCDANEEIQPMIVDLFAT
ncbi:hypothetical protein JOB18_044489 [Solea senegalensis]|uniref:Uncharacterized protein n=1 Tax=Solea senegalensis TaxID=28829 RepID=A0AAV6QBS1_SOLSE|nr:hypothetical protein JOB18_044489 [Solea senegalensis]